MVSVLIFFFFFSSRRRHTRLQGDWSSDVCSSDLFVGSEGTLGVISEATLKLVEKPTATATALIHFRHLEEVGQAVFDLLPLTPMALEVLDANTLDLIGRAAHSVPADAAAMLVAEGDGRP